MMSLHAPVVVEAVIIFRNQDNAMLAQILQSESEKLIVTRAVLQMILLLAHSVLLDSIKMLMEIVLLVQRDAQHALVPLFVRHVPQDSS